MRMARCTGLTQPIHVQGNKQGLVLSDDWTGDLDQIVGVRSDGHQETLAEALGPYLTHCQEVKPPTPAKPGRRESEAPDAPRQE